MQVFMYRNTSGKQNPLFKKLEVLTTLQILKAMAITTTPGFCSVIHPLLLSTKDFAPFSGNALIDTVKE